MKMEHRLLCETAAVCVLKSCGINTLRCAEAECDGGGDSFSGGVFPPGGNAGKHTALPGKRRRKADLEDYQICRACCGLSASGFTS